MTAAAPPAEAWSVSAVRPGPAGTVDVVAAVAAAMAELPAIGKDQSASREMGGYAYRGIEAITGNLQALLAKHRVLTVPNAEILTVVPSPGMNPGWVDVTVRVEWLIAAADGSSFTAVTNGIGRDKTDKGSNKAQTQAYKYLLLPLFCIADKADDGDGASYDDGRSTGRSAGADAEQRTPISKPNVESLTARCAGEGIDVAQVVRRATGGRTDDPTWVYIDEVQALRDACDHFAALAGGTPAAPAEADGPPPTPEPADGEGAGPPPPGPAPSTGRRRKEVSKQEVAMLADVVFLEAASKAPTGKKTAAKNALRYAATYAVTGGRAQSLDDLDPDGLLAVHDALEQIKAGAPFTYDFEPAAGAAFALPAGETSVLWAELTLDWPAPAAATTDGGAS
jgi:hypothetical protein